MKVIGTKRRRDRFFGWLVPKVMHYGLLLLSAISVYSAWVVLRGREIVTNDPVDDRLLLTMGFGFALAALVMLLFTREWSLRAVGQFWTYVGDATLWSGFGAARVHWRHPPTTGELQLIRAVFIVAIAALIAGLLWWLGRWGWKKWRSRKGWTGRERRRRERRQNWPPVTT